MHHPPFLFAFKALLFMPLQKRKQLQVALLVGLFVGKLRRGLARHRKRRELIQQWIDLQGTNAACLALLTQKARSTELPPAKLTLVLSGVEPICAQSQRVAQQLRHVLKQKGMQFGGSIIDICSSFQAYGQFLQSYPHRQAVLKEMQEGKATEARIAIEDSSQKIVFRTYKLSLLVEKYLKSLRVGPEQQHFSKALAVLNQLNKRHDHLLKHQQKLKEKQRIQKLLKRQTGSSLVYSEKCYYHSGQALLHVFQEFVGVESEKQLVSIQLDNYCSVFGKNFDGLHIGCLVGKSRTLHVLFPFSRQLSKFLRVLHNLIRCEDHQLKVTHTSLFTPFLCAQVVDFREGKDLRGNKREEFTIIFSALSETSPAEADIMRASLRESGLNWTDVDVTGQLMQLNETVTLSEQELQRVRQLSERDYGVTIVLPSLMDFSGQVSKQLLEMLKWECLLNGLLRSRTVVNNPILLLKQLQVTDVFLQSSLSRNTPHNCRLCDSIQVSSFQHFFLRRLSFLGKKYNEKQCEYCYHIFHKLREEVCRIPLMEIKSIRQLLAWRKLRSGAVDYCFRRRVSCEKLWQVQVGVVGVDFIFQFQVNQLTLVSEVIDKLCFQTLTPVLHGYRLSIFFEDQEVLLRPNDLLLPIIQYYNIKTEKCHSPTLLSTFKSIGRLLQLSQNGHLMLRQVIFYPLSAEERLQREWEFQLAAYQFRCEKFIGLPKESRIELTVLFAIRHLQAHKQQLPILLSHSAYEKFLPNSLEEQAEENRQLLQKIYDRFKEQSRSEVDSLIEQRLSASPLYRKYVWEMRVDHITEGLSSGKRLKCVLLAVGWEGPTVITLNERIILTLTWSECSLSLGRGGLRIGNERESITLRGIQLYETYSICRQYQSARMQAEQIKQA